MTDRLFATEFDEHATHLLGHEGGRSSRSFSRCTSVKGPSSTLWLSPMSMCWLASPATYTASRIAAPARSPASSGYWASSSPQIRSLLFGILGLGKENHELAQNVLLKDVARVSGSEARGALRKRFVVIRVDGNCGGAASGKMARKFALAGHTCDACVTFAGEAAARG
jgi:hypothetical protein